MLPAAVELLERGNEILKDFNNQPAEEFRMAMAYQVAALPWCRLACTIVHLDMGGAGPEGRCADGCL